MTHPKSLTAAAAMALAAAMPFAVHAAPVQVFSEGFDNTSNLPGWVQVNRSNPAGDAWFQGNSSVFSAQSGASGSYIAASFLSAQGGDGTVDTWLMTPMIDLNGASTISFFTRGANDPGFSDKLQLYFGAGTGTDLSDFSSLLLTVGTGGYPTAWTQFSADLNFTGTARFAFRYTGDASTLDYIGIDSVRVISAVPEPASALMLGLGLSAFGLLRRRAAK